MRHVRSGTWELRVTVGRWDDGRPRTLYRTVSAGSEAEAAPQLVAFVNEMSGGQLPAGREVRDLTVDEGIERYLIEYLSEEKGRADKTVMDYRNLHRRWFSHAIGARPVKRIESSVMDEIFGEMRRAGLSASRLNQAKSLYVPFFRWAKRRGMTLRNPMTDFQMPTSTYRSTERTPPEVDELSLLLSTAVEVTPDIAPLLVLAAVTGTRRAELVAIPRSAVAWKKNQLTVDTAVSSSGRVKTTKTGRGRTFHVDAETVSSPAAVGSGSSQWTVARSGNHIHRRGVSRTRPGSVRGIEGRTGLVSSFDHYRRKRRGIWATFGIDASLRGEWI
jgi:site-specific recombinase XerC